MCTLGGLMMTAIGIIAEDRSDCDAFAVLIRRIRGDGGSRSAIRKSPTHGCGKLLRKAKAKLRELHSKGCDALVIVHDLDRNPANQELRSERQLRELLEAIPYPTEARRYICIPVEELEAWFWCDQALLDLVARGFAKAHPSPHQIRQPKEKLIDASFRAHNKPLFNTNKNQELAAELDLDLCASRCPAFNQFRTFIQSLAA